ncbi:acyl-CoA dehydrogenase family protein [Variovorax sp. Varisp36]|uniref:acyl-CoA dehydrogenase family protein n=1 Tax=Variovorax sp. Varisp36 TaxID=3243031 RepID=UPI0039A565EB
MPFHAEPMFPGDLYDTTLRVAAAATTTADADAHASSATWRQFLGLGWQAVLVAEASGGAGASLGDIAAIAEAAGRHALAAPLVERCAVVPTLLSRIGGNPAAETLLGDIASGEASVCPVLALDDAAPAARLQGARVVLHGSLRGADLTEPVTHLLAFVALDGKDALVLLPRAVLAGAARSYTGIDARHTTDIDVEGLALPEAAVLLSGAAVRPLVDHANAVGALLSCAQMVGAIGAMIEQTIEYLGTREQFGVALATFQALRHKVVEMYVAYENVRGMVRQQVLVLDGMGSALPGREVRRELALVKLYLAFTGRQVAETAIQLHGGIGMSRELPAARLAMHALACSQRWGDRFSQLDRLAADAVLH